MTSVVLPRPAERVAILSLILVFLCGGVAGAMVMSFWHHRPNHQPPSEGMTISVWEWRQELDLSDEQTRKLTSILDDFSHYYDNVLADGNSRVLEILTSEQKQRYAAMMRAHKQKIIVPSH